MRLPNKIMAVPFFASESNEQLSSLQQAAHQNKHHSDHDLAALTASSPQSTEQDYLRQLPIAFRANRF